MHSSQERSSRKRGAKPASKTHTLCWTESETLSTRSRPQDGPALAREKPVADQTLFAFRRKHRARFQSQQIIGEEKTKVNRCLEEKLRSVLVEGFIRELAQLHLATR